MDGMHTIHRELPDDSLEYIFSLLDLESVAMVKQVSSAWNRLGGSPALLARVCEQFTHFPAASIGNSTVDAQERHRAFKALPKNILKILLSPCAFSEDAAKKVHETHRMIYIPQKRGIELCHRFNKPFFIIPISCSPNFGTHIMAVHKISEVLDGIKPFNYNLLP